MKSDSELVLEMRQGDKSAFSELVRRHQRGLLRLALRMTRDQALAEDVVQESFFKVYQKIDLFEGRASFKSWLFQIALNTAKNKFREKGRDSVSVDDLHLGVDSGAEIGLLRAASQRRIRDEVDRLPERQKMALSLRIYEDLSFKEIAEIMECPYDTAKANYRHALLKLREHFERERGLSLTGQGVDGGFDVQLSEQGQYGVTFCVNRLQEAEG
jgi:RNA polymerase sigma-70 factor (ECF subfamily)